MALAHRQRVSKIKNIVKKIKADSKSTRAALKSWEVSAMAEIKAVADIGRSMKFFVEGAASRVPEYEKLVKEFTALEEEVEQLKGGTSATDKKKLKDAEKKLKAKDQEASELAEVLESVKGIVEENIRLIREGTTIAGID